MESNIGRSHIMTSVRKVYHVCFLCPGVANKYTFDNARGKLGQ